MKRLFPVICLFSCLITAHSFAGSATWNLNPTSGDWNTAVNWTPATVPNAPTDVATFSNSQITDLTLSSPTIVASSVYAANADGFTITSAGQGSLTFAGDGIVNTSATSQSFVINTDEASNGGLISFTNSATISGPAKFTINGQYRSGNINYSTLEFHDNSNAGSARFVCEPGQVQFAGAGQIEFFESANAGTGEFICEGTPGGVTQSGVIFFNDNSTAGNGTFTVNAGNYFSGYVQFHQSATADHGTFTTKEGAGVSFFDTADAANATIIVNGSDLSYIGYGGLVFYDQSTPGNSTIIVNSGAMSGGLCTLNRNGSTGAPSVSVFGNGQLNLSVENDALMTIGSLEGNGNVVLGHGAPMIGTNNRSTEFDGLIVNAGSWTKVGTGTLTLNGANLYRGVTTILDGGLKVNNTAGSGTGSGAVKVSGGTLSGRGIISGQVTVGTGSGTGGIIAPSQGASNPTTLTLQNQLIFQSSGSYLFRLNTNKATADQVIASGVSIKSGAQFNFNTVANKKLTAGTVFTAINNTSATAIIGTFANLADGSTVTVGANKLQVSYAGGDGNDLTLTVSP